MPSVRNNGVEVEVLDGTTVLQPCEMARAQNLRFRPLPDKQDQQLEAAN